MTEVPVSDGEAGLGTTEYPGGRLIWADVLDGLRSLPDSSVDLVVIDPPYWKVADDAWDKQWMYHSDYAAWVSSWLIEIVRVMKRAGSLYLFGYPRNVLPMFPLFQEHPLRFRQVITWDKGVAVLAGRATKTHQMFSTTTEHIFFWQGDSRSWIKNIMRQRQRELGLTSRDINERLGVSIRGGGVWSLVAGENNFGTLPSKEMWPKIQDLLGLHSIDHQDFYPVFNVTQGVTDVWRVPSRVKGRFHSAQKPEEVIARIVRASSVPGMVVLDPFLGSATTAKVCQDFGDRLFIGIERDLALRPKIMSRLGIEEVFG